MLSSDAWLPSHPPACSITNSLSLSLCFSFFQSFSVILLSIRFDYTSVDLSSSLSVSTYSFLTLSEVPSHFSSFFHFLVSQFLPVKMRGRAVNKGELGLKKKTPLSLFLFQHLLKQHHSLVVAAQLDQLSVHFNSSVRSFAALEFVFT